MKEIVEVKGATLSNFVNYERDGYVSCENYMDNRRYSIKIYRDMRENQRLIVELYQHSLEEYVIEYNEGDASCEVINKFTAHPYQLSWRNNYNGHYFELHRDDGPAVINFNEYGCIKSAEWFINGRDITADVECWIDDMDFPVFHKWTNDHKIAFKLTFS